MNIIKSFGEDNILQQIEYNVEEEGERFINNDLLKLLDEAKDLKSFKEEASYYLETISQTCIETLSSIENLKED